MTQTATGGTTTDQAREKAQEVGSQAKEKAQEAGAQARSRVRDEVDRRSTDAGHQAGSAAQALRDASSKLRQDGNEPVARGMEQVADRVDRAGGWLRDSDGDAILRDVEDFGRRNSLAVIAGGLAIGFAASRLLKASSSRRYESGIQRPESRSSNGATTTVRPPDPALGSYDPAIAPRGTDPAAGPYDPAVVPPLETQPPAGTPRTASPGAPETPPRP